MNEFLQAAVMPHIFEITSVVLTGVITVAAQAIRKWTGLKIEEQHRRALHSAVMTGIEAAVMGKRTDEQVVAAAVEYARTLGAPDAVKALKVKPAALEQLARSKLTAAARP